MPKTAFYSRGHLLMVMMVEDDGGESNNLRGATIQKLNEAGV